MTGQQFADEFQDLMSRAFAEKPPLPQMIYELELAKQKCCTIEIAREQAICAAAASKEIILKAPAGLKLPPRPNGN